MELILYSLNFFLISLSIQLVIIIFSEKIKSKKSRNLTAEDDYKRNIKLVVKVLIAIVISFILAF